LGLGLPFGPGACATRGARCAGMSGLAARFRREEVEPSATS